MTTKENLEKAVDQEAPKQSSEEYQQQAFLFIKQMGHEEAYNRKRENMDIKNKKFNPKRIVIAIALLSLSNFTTASATAMSAKAGLLRGTASGTTHAQTGDKKNKEANRELQPLGPSSLMNLVIYESLGGDGPSTSDPMACFYHMLNNLSCQKAPCSDHGEWALFMSIASKHQHDCSMDNFFEELALQIYTNHLDQYSWTQVRDGARAALTHTGDNHVMLSTFLSYIDRITDPSHNKEQWTNVAKWGTFLQIGMCPVKGSNFDNGDTCDYTPCPECDFTCAIGKLFGYNPDAMEAAHDLETVADAFVEQQCNICKEVYPTLLAFGAQVPCDVGCGAAMQGAGGGPEDFFADALTYECGNLCSAIFGGIPGHMTAEMVCGKIGVC